MRCESNGTDYFPNTTSIPARISINLARGSLPTRSVRSPLSSVISRPMLAIESFGRPVRRAESETLPGALAHRRLLVNGTHTTVAIRLRLTHRPGPLQQACEILGRNRWVWEDLPTKLRLCEDYHSLRFSTRNEA